MNRTARAVGVGAVAAGAVLVAATDVVTVMDPTPVAFAIEALAGGAAAGIAAYTAAED